MSEPRRKLSILVPELPWLKAEIIEQPARDETKDRIAAEVRETKVPGPRINPTS